MEPTAPNRSWRAYHLLDGLDRYYFEDSWVLSITAAEHEVTFVVEAVLTENHPDVGPPQPGEQHRYQTIRTRFADADSVTYAPSGARPTVDASGETDLGNIDSFTGDGGGGYALVGDWGTLDVVNATLSIAPLDG